MNAKKIIIIVMAVLLAWTGGATGIAVYFGRSYSNLQSSLAESGKGELLTIIKSQRSTILELQDDLGTAGEHIRAADEFAAEIEQRDQRIYELAQLTNAELVDIGNTMASSGGTLQAAISLQQRIIESFRRIQANNSAIALELGVRPRTDTGRGGRGYSPAR